LKHPHCGHCVYLGTYDYPVYLHPEDAPPHQPAESLGSTWGKGMMLAVRVKNWDMALRVTSPHCVWRMRRIDSTGYSATFRWGVKEAVRRKLLGKNLADEVMEGNY
jgi:hypothetical protein